jgi:hypothetical protein
MQDGDLAYIESFRSYAKLSRLSTTTANGTTVFATPGGGAGRWFRLEDVDPSWASQTAWFIDEVNGDDENDGATSGTALQSWGEFTRRVKTITADTTVTLLSTMTDPLIGTFQGVPTGVGLGVPVLTIQGTPSVVASGTILARVNPNPAGNAEGTLTSAEIAAWTAGTIVESNEAGVLRWAPVLADVAGTAQVPFWASETSFALSHTLPAVGAAIRVINGSEVPSFNLATPDIASVIFRIRYLNVTGGGALSSTINGGFCFVEACQFQSGFDAGEVAETNLVGCAILAGGDLNPRAPFGMLLYGGISLAAQSFSRSAYITFDGFISYASLTIGASSGDVQGWSAAQIKAGGSGLGVFNANGAGVIVSNGGRLDVPNTPGALYGDGNVGVGLLVGDGGVCQINTITPTITGTVQEIALDGQATCVPPLTAADLAVPAAAALATWAQWAAAPFNRVAVNYAFTAAATGAASMARIIGT